MVIFSEILERLKIITGKTKDKEIAEILGVKEPTLNRWKARNSIPCEELIEYANKQNVNLNYLLLGKGDIRIDENEIQQSINGNNNIGNINNSNIKIFQSNNQEIHKEILQDLQKLPEQRQQYYYHKIKAETLE